MNPRASLLNPVSKRSFLLLAVFLPVAGMAATPREIWDEQCASCHAPNGDGKTKIGKKLHCKDYTDPKMQAEFSDAGLLKAIWLGIGAESHADRMPAYKDKLTAAEAKEQVALIRSFKK